MFEGERVSMGGYVPPRGPVVQVQVQAAVTWVRRLLSEALYAAAGAVVPWLVRGADGGGQALARVGAGAEGVRAFMRREPAVLSAREVAFFLKRYSRATPEQA